MYIITSPPSESCKRKSPISIGRFHKYVQHLHQTVQFVGGFHHDTAEPDNVHGTVTSALQGSGGWQMHKEPSETEI